MLWSKLYLKIKNNNEIIMLIKFNDLYDKYNLKISGLLHVGAHLCEEITEYEKYLPRHKILWIEGNSEKVKISKSKYVGLLIEEAVVSDKIEEVTFNISNNEESSSILELELHKIYYPNIYYTDSIKTTTNLLRNILSDYEDIQFNFINLDIQGAELKALKGLDKYLNNIDYIYTEVNKDYLYKDCALINEIDEYLEKYNFVRVELKMLEDVKWGDAFYIKNKK
jgi:FkbM family methyltransferase